VYHVDVGSNSGVGLDDLLFSLCATGGLAAGDAVLVPPAKAIVVVEATISTSKISSMARCVPSVQCLPPREALQVLLETNDDVDVDTARQSGEALLRLYDMDKFLSPDLQRPFQTLQLFKRGSFGQLDNFCYREREADAVLDIRDFFATILFFCPVQAPSWAELSHFVSFLNVQLKSTEQSVFCSRLVRKELPGMKTMVVRFLIRMAQDFSSRSVEVSDESHGAGFSRPVIADRRSWENSPHPYIFFNDDGVTMTFFGLGIDRVRRRDLISTKVLTAFSNTIWCLRLRERSWSHRSCPRICTKA